MWQLFKKPVTFYYLHETRILKESKHHTADKYQPSRHPYEFFDNFESSTDKLATKFQLPMDFTLTVAYYDMNLDLN